jgi:LmbE family N-acetylglucosaminyl deacetylase
MSVTIERNKKILVLAPHTDDGELGAGGTIAKLLQLGNEVYYAAFSTAEQSVKEGFQKDILKTEVKNATKVLGIKEENLVVFNYEVRRLN